VVAIRQRLPALPVCRGSVPAVVVAFTRLLVGKAFVREEHLGASLRVGKFDG